ncbi:MAG: hypothetical protein ACMG6E_04845 [Candidatus Roizmanbacteria bacterium]
MAGPAETLSNKPDFRRLTQNDVLRLDKNGFFNYMRAYMEHVVSEVVPQEVSPSHPVGGSEILATYQKGTSTWNLKRMYKPSGEVSGHMVVRAPIKPTQRSSTTSLFVGQRILTIDHISPTPNDIDNLGGERSSYFGMRLRADASLDFTLRGRGTSADAWLSATRTLGEFARIARNNQC